MNDPLPETARSQAGREARGSRNRRRVEEIANSLTHGSGLALSAVGAVFLVGNAVMRGDARMLAANSIFALSLLALYGFSTWYHGSGRPRTKRILRRFDHGAIYLLIAGSNTPFLLLTVGGTRGYVLLGIIWFIALLGLSLKLVAIRIPEWLSVASYLSMGWMAVLVIRPIYERLPGAGFTLLIAGGLAYTLGVYFYILSRKAFHHAIWHLFVLVGSACHFFAVLLHVL